jgi:branched-chain amino acid aminotransferase
MYAADEVFCTGTMGEIAGVTEIDGRTIGTGEPGPQTARIGRLYQQHARSHGVRLLAAPGDEHS